MKTWSWASLLILVLAADSAFAKEPTKSTGQRLHQ